MRRAQDCKWFTSTGVIGKEVRRKCVVSCCMVRRSLHASSDASDQASWRIACLKGEAGGEVTGASARRVVSTLRGHGTSYGVVGALSSWRAAQGCQTLVDAQSGH